MPWPTFQATHCNQLDVREQTLDNHNQPPQPPFTKGPSERIFTSICVTKPCAAFCGTDPVPQNPCSTVPVPRSWFRGLLVPRFCCNRQGRPQLMRTGTRANRESCEPGFMGAGTHGNRDSGEPGFRRTGIPPNRESTKDCACPGLHTW